MDILLGSNFPKAAVPLTMTVWAQLMLNTQGLLADRYKRSHTASLGNQETGFCQESLSLSLLTWMNGASGSLLTGTCFA